jgi:transposase InsO family protein
VTVNQATHPVGTMCRLLKVSRSGFHAWQARVLSKRARQDLALKGKIEAIHRRSHEAYGSPRVHLQLRAEGVCVSRKRVERLMREMKLQGACRRKFITTTQRDANARPAPDLVNRHFAAAAPNQLWVADATYIPTWAGFMYLAIVLDVYSRRIVGWALENHLRTELMLSALDQAYAQRHPHEVIHHSDQGTQYTSIAFGNRCHELGVRPSMGSVGDCFDNAMAESFFATLECELLAKRPFKTHTEARLAIFEYLEGFYNPHRLHSSLGYVSPVNFERRYSTRKSSDCTLPPVH